MCQLCQQRGAGELEVHSICSSRCSVQECHNIGGTACYMCSSCHNSCDQQTYPVLRRCGAGVWVYSVRGHWYTQA